VAVNFLFCVIRVILGIWIGWVIQRKAETDAAQNIGRQSSPSLQDAKTTRDLLTYAQAVEFHQAVPFSGIKGIASTSSRTIVFP
jgi:uncharacterized membrane-anchored protein YhcB (DUF1043 family)